MTTEQGGQDEDLNQDQDAEPTTKAPPGLAPDDPEPIREEREADDDAPESP